MTDLRNKIAAVLHDAPERIKAWGSSTPRWGAQWKCCPLPMQPMVDFPAIEYVRDDIAAAATERAVRAALEAAAELAGCIMRDARHVPISHQELTMTLWETIRAIRDNSKAVTKIIEGAQDAKR